MTLLRAGGALAAVLTLALLTGCAEPAATSPSAAPSRVPVPTVPVPTVPVPTVSGLVSPAPAPVTPAGTAHLPVHAGPPPAGAAIGPAWRIVTARPGDRSVVIAWYDAPTAACGAATDVWVQESADQVIIDLTRRVPRPRLVCPALVAGRRMAVPLTAPLGSRTLLEHAVTPVPRSTCPPGPLKPAASGATPGIACPLGGPKAG